MLRNTNQMTLRCDGCDVIFDDRPRHEGDQIEKARHAGWEIGIKYHYCPVCKKGTLFNADRSK